MICGVWSEKTETSRAISDVMLIKVEDPDPRSAVTDHGFLDADTNVELMWVLQSRKCRRSGLRGPR